ncbi:MAG: MarR family winged helix-turn-helix transcriptional regulator [Anaerolineales bacterium]
MTIVKMDYSENAEKIPGFLLWQVSKLWQRHLNAALSDLGISGTQAVILGNIVRLIGQGNEATQILLSEITKIDPMTTSQSIRALERKRLVKRVISTEDKRAFTISPTPKGIRVTEAALDRFIQSHLSFFKPVEENLDVLTAVLLKLVRAAGSDAME